jgi:serine O-acetyltransferase
LQNLKADIAAIRGRPKPPGTFTFILLAVRYWISSRAFREVALYRIGHSCRKIIIIRELLQLFQSWFSRIEVPFTAEIGPGLSLPHPYDIVLIPDCKIGARVSIYQGVTIGIVSGKTKDGRTSPVIGDDVMLYTGAKILGPVTIGNHVTVGANSVVLTDIPDNTNAAGVPARIISRS